MTPAHTIAAQACLGMLLHLDKDITPGDLEKLPLAKYAAEHWADHARFEDVSQKVEGGMKQLFDPRRCHFAVWVWIRDLEDPCWRREKRGEKPSQASGLPLHYAALCGLNAIVKFLLIERSQVVDSRDFDHESTALHFESRRGHEEVIRILLCQGADVTAQTKDGSTSLHLASRGAFRSCTRSPRLQCGCQSQK